MLVWRVAGMTVGALMLGTVAAPASEATTVADRAGFLLGHAYRCGVEDKRLNKSEALATELIAAFAIDRDDKQSAETGFAQSYIAGAFAELVGEPVASCEAIRNGLARLEKHRRPTMTGNERKEAMAHNDRPTTAPAKPGRSAAAQPAKGHKPASTSREDLTAERRAALELRLAAQQQRGRPPSI